MSDDNPGGNLNYSLNDSLNGSLGDGTSHSLEESLRDGIDNLEDVVVCTNDEGSCLLIERKYPLPYIYGGCRLEETLEADMAAMMMACPQDSCGKSYADAVSAANATGASNAIEAVCTLNALTDFAFFDIETTGLSGGVGTVAFLAGLGYFCGDFFVIRQYFMRDYDEEPAMLYELNSILSGHKGLVTFNGKAFDWNIITGRYIFNRMKLGLRDPIHIDLLHPARRLWKLKLESCRLSSLENNILNEPRYGDIPGELIPQAYFQYLEDRKADDITKVIRHNGYDILSMVSLLVKIAGILSDPVSRSDGGYELLGAARIHEDRNLASPGSSEDYYTRCTGSDLGIVRETASKRLGMIYKKSGRFEEAAKVWSSIIDSKEMPDIPAVIELAKHYEHREKDYLMAADLVSGAIRRLAGIGAFDSPIMDSLRSRLKRLEGKLKSNATH